MAIIKFKDLCCPVHSVKLVQIDEKRDVSTLARLLEKEKYWILEVHIEITSAVPHFRKFHYESEQECVSDYEDLIKQLEDKGWGNGNI